MKEGNVMQKRKPGEKGFTLIEVIVTLMLVGITAVLAGMWIVSIASAYIFTQMNANTTQKAQLAMTRLTKEFTTIMTVDAGATNGTQITFTRPNVALTPVNVVVSWSGNLLQANVAGTGAQTLTDSVSAFALSYCDSDMQTCGTNWTSSRRVINFTLTLTGADNTTSAFTQRITPRNY